MKRWPEQVSRAAALLRGRVLRTPLLRRDALGRLAGHEVYLKLESLQLTGAFKFRGALHRVLKLPPGDRARGLIAASSGNHALGVAMAAASLGIPVTVVMPGGAPAVKRARARDLGAELILAGAYYDESLARARELAADTGRQLIPSFDDLAIVEGQGTVGLEMLDDQPELDCLVAPVGGGGLLAGLAMATRGRRVDLVGVQAQAAPAGARSIESGCLTRVLPEPTVADGIAVAEPGRVPLEILREAPVRVHLVSEDEIRRAVGLLAIEEKVWAEPAAAAAVAAVLAGAVEGRGRKVGVVVTGGNISPALMCEILDEYGNGA